MRVKRIPRRRMLWWRVRGKVLALPARVARGRIR
jgi:hypothetical protein